jgi:hypothetical protein
MVPGRAPAAVMTGQREAGGHCRARLSRVSLAWQSKRQGGFLPQRGYMVGTDFPRAETSVKFRAASIFIIDMAVARKERKLRVSR